MTYGATILRTVLPVCILALAGCAGRGVSNELTDARVVVERARESEARRYAPLEVAKAEQILGAAEAQRDGSRMERHYAYLADRQARIAIADAHTAHVAQATNQAERTYVAELERTIRERGTAVATAEEGRAELEQELSEAISRLEEFATVREEVDRTVITLTGEVLFETDKAQLRPEARQRLGQVAEALTASPHGTIVVAGHTDAHGSESYNQALSERRAESVKRFLVDEGVAANEIETVGRGETEPMADNTSPEGRANNRRVEIILPKEAPAQE